MATGGSGVDRFRISSLVSKFSEFESICCLLYQCVIPDPVAFPGGSAPILPQLMRWSIGAMTGLDEEDN